MNPMGARPTRSARTRCSGPDDGMVPWSLDRTAEHRPRLNGIWDSKTRSIVSSPFGVTSKQTRDHSEPDPLASLNRAIWRGQRDPSWRLSSAWERYIHAQIRRGTPQAQREETIRGFRTIEERALPKHFRSRTACSERRLHALSPLVGRFAPQADGTCVPGTAVARGRAGSRVIDT
jgi:hypothetical protein